VSPKVSRMARAFMVCLVALVWAPALAFGGAQAVSGPNGKLSVEGGQYDNDQAFLALGSYTMPLGQSFGLQADGALGRIDEDTMSGGGLHLFTRDPSSYLLGLYGSYHTWNNIDIWRAAAEFQLYMRQFSLEGIAGFESVNVPTTSGGLAVLNTDDNHAFGQVDFSYYPIDNLRLYVGYRYVDETSLGGAGIEYLLRSSGSPISLFAKGDFGDAEFNRITGGLKIYLGPNPGKSLIERHRTEDPENYTPAFPTLKTQTAGTATSQCTINSDFFVVSPANGQCTCPPGTLQAGGAPSPTSNGYACFNPN
jgi:hypothetical protein